MGFYGSNDPTYSVKALKVVVLRRGFNPTRSGPPHHVTILHMHAITDIQKMNLSTVKWAQ